MDKEEEEKGEDINDLVNHFNELDFAIEQSFQNSILRPDDGTPKKRLTHINEIPESSSLVTGMKEMRGYLEKFSPALLKGWQRRYVILKDHKLKYYLDFEEQHLQAPQGVINFDNFQCSVEPVNQKCFNLKMEGQD